MSTASPLSPNALPLSRRLALASTASLAVALTVAACGNSGSAPAASSSPSATATTPAASASPETSASASALESEEAQDESTQAWTSGHSESAESGDAGVETALRAGRHEGYDRVVVQASGTGTLGWYADIEDEAFTQGKGDAVELEGSKVLRIFGRGTHMPASSEDQAAAYSGPQLLEVGGSAIRQAYLDPTFEAQFQLLLGVDSTEYRIFTLSEPSRLVVDVKHP